MKNILMFAAIAGAVAAVAIYLTENNSTGTQLNYIADAAEDEYNTANENVSDIGTSTGRGFNAMS